MKNYIFIGLMAIAAFFAVMGWHFNEEYMHNWWAVVSIACIIFFVAGVLWLFSKGGQNKQ